MKRVLLIFLVALGCEVAFAKRLDIKWNAIPGAARYEYELSRSEAFTGELVRSGSTKNQYFVTDLGPGIYFLRVRSLGENDRAGAWSQGSRLVVEADTLSIQKPAAAENIELASEMAPFLAEWSAIEGADDYLVQIQRGKEGRNIISPTNSVRLDGLRSGAWTISIAARSGGQVVQKSSEVNFRVTINPKPRPVIYSPVSGETAVAWDNFTIRWLNRSPTPKSEVVIKRMGDKGGVVSREIVYGRAETLTPKLPPGPYQISVRNLYDNMASEAGVVDVTTVEDAMGYHAKFFGVSAHATLGPTWGSTGFRSAAYGTDSVTNKNSSGELEMRLVADLTEEWGVEFGGGLRGDRFRDRRELSTLTDAYVMVDAVRLNTNAYLGVRHKLEPLGPSKPLWLRLALYWNQIEMPIAGTGNTFDVASTSEPRFVLTNARTWGSMLGGELRWGGYRSRWDAVGRVDLLVPIIGRGAVLATGGASPWWPGLEFRVTPRVKVSSDMRLGLTLGGRLQAVTLKESSGESSKYYSRRIFFMPNFSWDL